LVVAHYRRAQPLFLKIKSLLDEKVIGEIRFVDLKMLQPAASDIIANSEENWRINPAISGGGLFHDLAPHQLDLMLYYFGEAINFHGLARKQNSSAPVADLVTGHIEFANNVVFNGLWCFSAPKSEQVDCCDIIGSRGKITFSVFGQYIKINIEGKEEILNFEPLPHVEQPMIAQVVSYFRGQGENPCAAEEALKTMRIMDAFTK